MAFPSALRTFRRFSRPTYIFQIRADLGKSFRNSIAVSWQGRSSAFSSWFQAYERTIKQQTQRLKFIRSDRIIACLPIVVRYSIEKSGLSPNMAIDSPEWTKSPNSSNWLLDGLVENPTTDVGGHKDSPKQSVKHQSTLPSDPVSLLVFAHTTASPEQNAVEVGSAKSVEPNPNRHRVRFVEEPTWQIYVRMPKGYTIVLKVRPSNTAKDIRFMISQRVGIDKLEEQCIPEEFQRLLYNFRRLQDDKTLVENHISDNSNLDLFGRTLGQL